jgi:hypothetical protein
MANGLIQGDQYIRSNEQANTDENVNSTGYGQNGYLGPSSDTKIGKTKSGFLPGAVPPVNSQTRQVNADPIAAAHGMRNRNAESASSIPANGRPVKK